MSTTSNRGCSRRALLFAAGGLLLAVAGIALFAFESRRIVSYIHQSRWPVVQATVRECKLVPRRRRNSVQTAQAMECSVEFVDASGNRVHGGFSSRPMYDAADIEKLRAWMAQHPAGSSIAVRYNPSWAPETEPDKPGEIFY